MQESRKLHEIGELAPLSEESNGEVQQELASTFQGHLVRRKYLNISFDFS